MEFRVSVYPRSSSSPLSPWCIEYKTKPETTMREAGYISRCTFCNAAFSARWGRSLGGCALLHKKSRLYVCAITNQLHFTLLYISQEIGLFSCCSAQIDLSFLLGSSSVNGCREKRCLFLDRFLRWTDISPKFCASLSLQQRSILITFTPSNVFSALVKNGFYTLCPWRVIEIKPCEVGR